MIVIVGHWEDNKTNPFSGRLDDVGRWINQLIAYGIDRLVMVDDTKAKVPIEILQAVAIDSPEPLARDFKIERANSLEEALKLYPKLTKVYVESRILLPEKVTKVTSLFDFVHPANAIYIFGGDFVAPFLARVPDVSKDEVVSIDYTNSQVSLYAQEALACILYDRAMKER